MGITLGTQWLIDIVYMGIALAPNTGRLEMLGKNSWINKRNPDDIRDYEKWKA